MGDKRMPELRECDYKNGERGGRGILLYKSLQFGHLEMIPLVGHIAMINLVSIHYFLQRE